MKKDDFRRMARDPKFIAGIYNYCDRWCERCVFTDRCMTFAMEQAEDEREGGRPGDAKAFWKRFESAMNATEAMVAEMAKEHGIRFVPDQLAELSREEQQRHEDAGNHPLAQSAFAYDEAVDAWFMAGEESLREKEEEILAQARLGVERVKEEVVGLTEVVEILRWYQPQIYVKLMRALDADREFEAKSELPKDSDGSAKVALIGMDRSIAAWLRMKDFFPGKTDSILTQLVQLDRLRRATEQEFPGARSFVRPGFDVAL